MTMARVVTDEALDFLPAADPSARRSRRDLRRIHRAMGTRSILLRALREVSGSRRERRPWRVLELGAGDGTLMLGVARALRTSWPCVELSLLDRLSLVDEATVDAYARVGWTVTEVNADVLAWADDPGASRAHWDVIVANLFLHHFEPVQLQGLLRAIAARADRFVACEPRRGRLAWAGSHLIGAIGAGAVTRADSVRSVHAGFRADELTRLWPPAGGGWDVREYAAGLFSHCLLAQRTGAL